MPSVNFFPSKNVLYSFNELELAVQIDDQPFHKMAFTYINKMMLIQLIYQILRLRKYVNTFTCIYSVYVYTYNVIYDMHVPQVILIWLVVSVFNPS